MKKQEIAKKLFGINWITVQGDSPSECQKVEFLKDELEGLSKEDIIETCFAVIEAEQLDKHEPFKDLKKFEYL